MKSNYTEEYGSTLNRKTRLINIYIIVSETCVLFVLDIYQIFSSFPIFLNPILFDRSIKSEKACHHTQLCYGSCRFCAHVWWYFLHYHSSSRIYVSLVIVVGEGISCVYYVGCWHLVFPLSLHSSTSSSSTILQYNN